MDPHAFFDNPSPAVFLHADPDPAFFPYMSMHYCEVIFKFFPPGSRYAFAMWNADPRGSGSHSHDLISKLFTVLLKNILMLTRSITPFFNKQLDVLTVKIKNVFSSFVFQSVQEGGSIRYPTMFEKVAI